MTKGPIKEREEAMQEHVWIITRGGRPAAVCPSVEAARKEAANYEAVTSAGICLCERWSLVGSCDDPCLEEYWRVDEPESFC